MLERNFQIIYIKYTLGTLNEITNSDEPKILNYYIISRNRVRQGKYWHPCYFCCQTGGQFMTQGAVTLTSGIARQIFAISKWVNSTLFYVVVVTNLRSNLKGNHIGKKMYFARE